MIESDLIPEETMVFGEVRWSRTIGKLALALSRVQKELPMVSKDRTANTGKYTYNYADLAAYVEAARELLAREEIACLQPPGAEGGRVTITTLLLHSSGEWLASSLSMTSQQPTPQGIGSAISYARRYALVGTLNMASGDDDGAAASQPPPPQRETFRTPPRTTSQPLKTPDQTGTAPPALSFEQSKTLQDKLKRCSPALQARFWKRAGVTEIKALSPAKWNAYNTYLDEGLAAEGQARADEAKKALPVPGCASAAQLKEISELIVDNGFDAPEYLAAFDLTEADLEPIAQLPAETAVKIIADLKLALTGETAPVPTPAARPDKPHPAPAPNGVNHARAG